MSPLRRHPCWYALLLSLIGPLWAWAGEDNAVAPRKATEPPNIIKLVGTLPAGRPTIRVDADCHSVTLPWLSWDTEGGDRAKNNLLRAGMSLQKHTHGKLIDLAGQLETDGPQQVRFRLASSPAPMDWTVRVDGGGLMMQLTGGGGGDADRLELVFPFNPRMAATTLLPASWQADGSLRLPAVISAPDFGQMLLTGTPRERLRGRLRGSREKHTVDFVLELPLPRSGETITLGMQPLYLPEPAELRDKSLWRAARRGWFNAFQPSAEWGDQGHPFSAPPGILANNVISDPVSCLIHMWADQALLTPPFSAGHSPDVPGAADARLVAGSSHAPDG